MKCFLIAVVCLGMTLWTGCATVAPVAGTTIQGTWKGQEVAAGQGSTSWLTLAGNDLEFKGPKGEWFRGTYTLNENTDPKQMTVVITQARQAEYVGKTAHAIYRLEPGRDDQATLIISGYEPGDAQVPAGFSDQKARQIIFTRD